LSKLFQEDGGDDLIDTLLASSTFREQLKQKIDMYGELLASINYDDDRNL
jgi:hypothetical protein